MNREMGGQRRAPGLEEALKKRLDFDRWRGQNRLEENVLVWRFFLGGAELPAWTAERIRRLDIPGWPPAQRSAWRLPDQDRALLLVETFECVDREAAHDVIIRAAAEYMTADMRRDQDDRLGDVTFYPPGETSVLFARANLVIRIHNGGPELVPVQEPAAALDRLVSERPETDREVAPRVTRLEGQSEVRVGAVAPLSVDASDPLERPVWFKLHARGDLALSEQGPVYRATDPGTDEVTVYAINENLRAGVRTLAITASQGKTS